MKLTDYIMNLGRPVAYYPNLTEVTGSVNASILLCQLLYWSNRVRGDWIYKDSFDLREETGLSVYEQQTARKALLDLGIITEQYKRLDHKIAFKVNEERVNDLCEEVFGETQPSPTGDKNPADELKSYQNPELHKNDIPPKNEPDNHHGKKGDLVDGVLFYAQSPGMRKEYIKNEIRTKLEKKLHINIDSKRWETFINFAYVRQTQHKEPIDTFIDYALRKGFDPIYWTPEKCKTVFPQAFIKEEDKIRENFVENPHIENLEKEEDYVDMPEHLRKKKKLY